MAVPVIVASSNTTIEACASSPSTAGLPSKPWCLPPVDALLPLLGAPPSVPDRPGAPARLPAHVPHSGLTVAPQTHGMQAAAPHGTQQQQQQQQGATVTTGTGGGDGCAPSARWLVVPIPAASSNTTIDCLAPSNTAGAPSSSLVVRAAVALGAALLLPVPSLARALSSPARPPSSNTTIDCVASSPNTMGAPSRLRRLLLSALPCSALALAPVARILQVAAHTGTPVRVKYKRAQGFAQGVLKSNTLPQQKLA